MIEKLAAWVAALVSSADGRKPLSGIDVLSQWDPEAADDAGIARSLNAAFLAALARSGSPEADGFRDFIRRFSRDSRWSGVAAFYLRGFDLIRAEIELRCREDSDFRERLAALASRATASDDPIGEARSAEAFWQVFMPEATGISDHREERVDALRAKRRVEITALNENPIRDPVTELLLTSNVLLTVPPDSGLPGLASLGAELREEVLRAAREPQVYWYDHPIPVGVDRGANEILYGLRGLDAALDFERERGNLPAGSRMTCVLSVSTTHDGLKGVANAYVRDELAAAGGVENLDVYLFTESDTRRIVENILAPAAEHYFDRCDGADLLSVFGVDGRYGRHYSFLKAIAAFWNILVDSDKRATFKIDLDQVFPQPELVAQARGSALELFKTPLWGARGRDAQGRDLELGMIAGALVNHGDIQASLFTPDVGFPDRELNPDEFVFFSALPQALSTEAEMMARYDRKSLDGRKHCVQRVHITGGTNGIRVDSLRRHRPFTPSFIGRAEDQAYLLSVLAGGDPRLAYVHRDGLIMRHDKEAFAEEAIRSATVGKLIGDYERILLFSAYAGSVGDVQEIKEVLDPFTGCFISRIPRTLVYLRFALKAASFFAAGQDSEGEEFVALGARRIGEAVDFASGDPSDLRLTSDREREGWDLYYDILSAIEDDLGSPALEDAKFARELRSEARELVRGCCVSPGKPLPGGSPGEV